MRQPLRLASLIVVAAALLVGCDGPPPDAPPATTPAAPRFATDEEALAAAEEAYGTYLAISDQVIRDGGVGVEALRDHMSAELFAAEEAGMLRLHARGHYGVGFTEFTLSLQRYDDVELIAYVCDDQTKSNLLDASGVSVVNPNGPRRMPFEVEFDVVDAMRMVRKDLWEGGGVC